MWKNTLKKSCQRAEDAEKRVSLSLPKNNKSNEFGKSISECEMLINNICTLFLIIFIFNSPTVTMASNIKDEVFAACMSDMDTLPSSSIAEDAAESGTNLLVNYLPKDMETQELHQLFNDFGAIKHVKIVRNWSTGESNGYGFVNFEKVNNARLAQMCLNGRQVRGKRLKVSVARPSSDDMKDRKVFIANLPYSYDEQQLMHDFGRYGKIQYLNILRDRRTSQSRGIAFVHYEWRSSAERAIASMNGSRLEKGKNPLLVQLSRPTDWSQSQIIQRGCEQTNSAAEIDPSIIPFSLEKDSK